MRPLLLAFAASATILAQSPRPADLMFEGRMIDPGASETAAVADINGDGHLDIVSGEAWYEAPTWTKHAFRTIDFASNYVDDFSDLLIDVNADGRIDVVSVSWFAKKIWWNENPGGSAKGAWKEHVVTSHSPVEFAFLVDLDNDGIARELLPQFGDAKAPLTWYALHDGRFEPRQVADRSFGHGIGAGDINGDGRNDILTPKGWLEAPAADGAWTLHEVWDLGQTSFLHVHDVNGDGRADVVSSEAHDYGLFWLEQGQAGAWTTHGIDDTWSQGHAVTFADLNGDGQPDLVTGKRYMAHNGKDPGEREPLGIYWYEYRRTPKGVEWIRHIVDYGSRAGGGMQVNVVPLTTGSPPSIVVGGKSGLFVYRRAER